MVTLSVFAVTGSGLLFSGCNGGGTSASSMTQHLALNDSGYFEARGLNVMVFSNLYDVAFDDSKISAVEMIHHGVRTITNGDVRLNPTPGQWDAKPQFVERKIDRENQSIDVVLKYPQYDFEYILRGRAADGGFYMSIHADNPLPEALRGIAGLNLEILPSAYFGKSYIMDGGGGLMPSYPADNMQTINGQNEPCPVSTGKILSLAPEDPLRHITVRSTDDSELMLFDGRNKAQNVWFVVRSLLPSGKTGKIAEWFITAETINNWVRRPVIAHSQTGYHPSQQKIAVIELDRNDRPQSGVTLVKIHSDGSETKVLGGKPQPWGVYLRYNYLKFDFSAVTEPGIYVLEYGDVRTEPFPIAADVYSRAWHPTMDVFLCVQMDHMQVREGYRIWHGASHLDDALQAPVNYSHWDGWRQGPVTGNKYKPLEHIPGLNVGGWFDAGDFDIQTGSQQQVVTSLSYVWELFRPTRDETTINQRTRYVEIHLPDGKPDIQQQIEHGVLQLLAQVKAVGYPINGINESHLYQYRHLGDAVTKTDNLIYNPRLDSLESDGRTSGTFDDRYAFTDRTPAMSYGSVAALAAASRALKGYDDALAAECLATAISVWKEEHGLPADSVPERFRRYIEMRELRAAVELLLATGDAEYKDRILSFLPAIKQGFGFYADMVARALPAMDESFRSEIEPLVGPYIESLKQRYDQMNPFGVTISTFLWGGNESIIQASNSAYMLCRVFPDLVDKELVYRGLNYIYGCHPDSDISYVSAVGARSKKVAYGNNRADFTFIAGGVVPGLRILNTDFPENKEDWPFLWSENEYTIGIAADYVYLVNAVNDLLTQ
ncbi:MAG: glycoside hydrolase family 9 protein [Tannerella sp.]|jgi:hypothetical protein|nr:glycoside hydrolase family 9 protein [Tannerella sp.]